MKNIRLFAFTLFLVALIVIIGMICSGSPPDKTPWCTTVEYEPPYKIVFVDGSANVYNGIDTPGEIIKGTVIIIGSIGGIEAKCASYYRLQGVDWWGWVKISDTYK